MLDWSTVASLATAAGTLVLAVATFSSVRSGNRSARVAERALLVGLRPLLGPTRFDDPVQKVRFVDGKWLICPAGGGAIEATDGAVYMAFGLRNVGSGMAVLHGWYLHPEESLAGVPHPELGEFRRLTRDLIVPPGDIGFWQGALRDPAEPLFATAHDMATRHHSFLVDVLYGDHEGGQRTISRFFMSLYGDDRWICTVGRHWNIDRPDPR